MNDSGKALFSEFSPVDKKEWLEKVGIDLKGADFDKKLVWKNLNKIKVPPFYNAQDKIEGVVNTGENSQTLANYREINVENVEKANILALKAIKEGINGLLFNVDSEVEVSALLADIQLDKVSVSFNLKANEIGFASAFFDFVENQETLKKDLAGYIDINLISGYVTSGSLTDKDLTNAAQLIKLSKPYPNYKGLTISGSEYLDSGANQAQEAGYTLSSLVYVINELKELGISGKEVFDSVNFKLAIGSEYFIEIGKFRAFNSLLNEIAGKYDVKTLNHSMLAKTSIWSKSVTDPHTNLLRATTEAMSAILGNVDAVLIDAYDKEFSESSDFSSRIAGNISTILKEESYLGKVANPVDGSYYIEEAGVQIATKALELFKGIETKGGFYKAFESEIIQQQIAEIRQQKIKLISQRRLPMVGVNKYPNLMETVSANLLSTGQEEGSKILKPRRASLEIEAIRSVTEKMVENTGARPIVELASFGNLTMRKARAAFAYDFIGVSGFDVRQEKSYSSAEEAAEQSAKSDSNVVVICSSDQDYAEKALEYVKSFRAINKDKVLLLAGNPIDLMQELTASGLDGVVNLRSDVITTISAVQNKIQKTIKPLEV